MRKLLAFVVAGLMTAVPAGVAAELPSWLTVEKNGVLQIENMAVSLMHFGPGWMGTRAYQLTDGRRSQENGTVTVTGKLSATELLERVIPVDRDCFRYEVSFQTARPADTLAITAEFLIANQDRSVWVDGREIKLKAEYDGSRKRPLPNTGAKRLSLILDSGSTLTVTGDFSVGVIDNREFKLDGYAIRLNFPKFDAETNRSALTLDFRLTRPVTHPLDLRGVVNMGFRDGVAGDGKGGWTDQGPENDLRSLKPGTLSVGALDFEVIDPERNGGRSALVLGGKFLPEATVKVSQDGRYLSLIHALAWHGAQGASSAEVGRIIVGFADGSQQEIPVRPGQDIGNWWGPTHFDNSSVVWSSENKSSYIGLGFSQFKLTRDDPRSVTFRSTGPDYFWMIVAANLNQGYLPRSGLNKSVYIVAGKEWVRLESGRDVVPGSPMDFSGMLDAPAGKYGRVKVAPDGHFTFENAPEKRIRFVGTNLCSSACFLEREEADALADRLAKMGFNAVRFHHHDGWLVQKGATSGLQQNAENLDKLEYLFAALKKRGIYITTDIYCSRRLRDGDGIPELPPVDHHSVMKVLLPVSNAAVGNWKGFARRWLLHRNPYTGMTWAEDPALYVVSLTNENALYWWLDRYPGIVELYRQKFNAWMKANYPGETAGAPDWKNNRRFQQFLYVRQRESARELMEFLRDELKVVALLTDVNMDFKIPLTLLRDDFEVVDNHKYHDHPHFPVRAWNLPIKVGNNSAVKRLGEEVPGRLFPSRLFGRPYGITEFKYCTPNRYRNEGGPLLGAYAALQGWDSLYQFTWAAHREKVIRETLGGLFDYIDEPLAQLSDRQMMLLFRRGDVKTSANSVAYRVPLNFWDGDEPVEYPDEFFKLGLITRIGSAAGDKVPEGGVLIDRKIASAAAPLPNPGLNALRENMLKNGVAVSDTGELRLDAGKQTLVVVTGRSESITVDRGALTAKRLSLSGAKGAQTVSVSSLDEKTLGMSGRLLLFHLTDVTSNKIRYADNRMELLLSWGDLPYLVRRDPVKIQLELEGDAIPKVEALKLNGGSYGTVPSLFRDGKLTFTADPGAFPGGVMVYAISR